MSKPLLLLTSWEAYDSTEEIQKFIDETVHDTPQVKYAIALSYAKIKELSAQTVTSKALFGALYLNSVEDSSFTASIAVKMLKQIGAAFTLVGSHFERTVLQQDNFINKKIRFALEGDLVPILCVGENSEEYLAGQAEIVLRKQLSEALAGFDNEQLTKIMIYFESPWIEQLFYRPTAEEVIKDYARDQAILEEIVGKETAVKMQIIHVAPYDVADVQIPKEKGIYIQTHHHLTVLEKAKATREDEMEEVKQAQEALVQIDDIEPPFVTLLEQQENLELAAAGPAVVITDSSEALTQENTKELKDDNYQHPLQTKIFSEAFVEKVDLASQIDAQVHSTADQQLIEEVSIKEVSLANDQKAMQEDGLSQQLVESTLNAPEENTKIELMQQESLSEETARLTSAPAKEPKKVEQSEAFAPDALTTSAQQKVLPESKAPRAKKHKISDLNP